MKRKIFQGVLATEAAVCVLFCFLKAPTTAIFAAAIAFPFEQIGAGLRLLSLSGALGNALAIALYCLLSLLPIGALLILRHRRKLFPEDSLLVLLSAVLFYAVYLMVNPGLIVTVPGIATGTVVGKAILGGLVYSLVIGYVILRVLRLFFAGTIQKLERYFTIMLGIVSTVFIFMAFGACLRDLLSSIASLQAGNTGNEHMLGLTYAFLGLQYVVNALPYILSVLIVFAALRLLSELQKERYSAASVEAAARMSRLCAVTLAATVLTNILYNLLQTLFAGSLMVLNHSVQVPIASILFVLAALLLTRLMMESKQLKEENDQFI